jgi:predicted outer membrane protein
MKYLALIAATLVAGSIAGRAVAAHDDSSFVTKVQQDLLGQYALAALARGHATGSAQSLANDVAKNAAAGNSWLKSYAPKHGISLPNKPSTIADIQYGQLQGLKGASFNKQLAKDLIVETELRMGTLRAEAAHNTELGHFAKKQLSAMEKFSKEAHSLAK